MTAIEAQKALTDTMSDRLQCLNEMIALASEQQSILVLGRHTDLADNVAKHEPVLMQLHQLDLREDELEQVLRGETVADPMLARRANDLESLTAEAVVTLRSIVDGNCQLLRNAADYVQFSMNVISQVACGSQSYDSQAESGQDTAQALMLDAKV